MNVKDIIKKQTTVIAIAVCLVTIAALGVSYALFFDIKEGSNQVITAGTLKLTISKDGKTSEDPMTTLSEPMSNDDGLKSEAINYTLKNTGNLPASYNLYICEANDNGVNINSIRVSTSDESYKSLGDQLEGTDGQNNIPKSNEEIGENTKGCYLIETGKINANQTETTKQLRVWIDEEAVNEDLNATVDLDLYLVSVVDEETAESTAGTGT